MKKFLALILAIAMLLTCASALAGETTITPTEEGTGSTATVSIHALKTSADPADAGNDDTLPIEYHVRVLWEKQQGQLDPTKIMYTGGESTAPAIAWDPVALKYVVLGGGTDPSKYTYPAWAGEGDETKFKARFEVVNASTPGLDINVKVAALGASHSSRPFLNMDETCINGVSRNQDFTATVKAVTFGEGGGYGTGVAGRAGEAEKWGVSANTLVGVCDYSWNYGAIANEMLSRYKTGVTTQRSLVAGITVCINPTEE